MILLTGFRPRAGVVTGTLRRVPVPFQHSRTVRWVPVSFQHSRAPSRKTGSGSLSTFPNGKTGSGVLSTFPNRKTGSGSLSTFSGSFWLAVRLRRIRKWVGLGSDYTTNTYIDVLRKRSFPAQFRVPVMTRNCVTPRPPRPCVMTAVSRWLCCKATHIRCCVFCPIQAFNCAVLFPAVLPPRRGNLTNRPSPISI